MCKTLLKLSFPHVFPIFKHSFKHLFKPIFYKELAPDKKNMMLGNLVYQIIYMGLSCAM